VFSDLNLLSSKAVHPTHEFRVCQWSAVLQTSSSVVLLATDDEFYRFKPIIVLVPSRGTNSISACDAPQINPDSKASLYHCRIDHHVDTLSLLSSCGHQLIYHASNNRDQWDLYRWRGEFLVKALSGLKHVLTYRRFSTLIEKLDLDHCTMGMCRMWGLCGLSGCNPVNQGPSSYEWTIDNGCGAFIEKESGVRSSTSILLALPDICSFDVKWGCYEIVWWITLSPIKNI